MVQISKSNIALFCRRYFKTKRNLQYPFINRAITVLMLISALITTSCRSCKNGNQPEVVEETFDDKQGTTLIKLQNSVFSLPSPYMLVKMVHNSGVAYNKSLLNSISNHSKYDDSFHKAINMGIYGADLAYINIYGQTPDAITYFSVIKLMAQDLQLESAFDREIAERVEKNISNYDSLIHIISTTYRKADSYLKESQRQDIGIFMLAGGWIESLYLLSKTADIAKNKELKAKIGEHKKPLKNVLQMLKPYISNSESLLKLYDNLSDLDMLFDEVGFRYQYKNTSTDATRKITRIECTSEVVISDNQFKEILLKINELRNQVTDQKAI